MANKEKYQLIKTVKCFDTKVNSRGKEERIDVLFKILRDENTGEKLCETIIDPTITYYVNKDEYWEDDPDMVVNQMPIDCVEEVTASSASIAKSVAYNTGMEEYWWDCIKNKKFGAANAVHLNPNVHGSDVDVEDYYIGKHYEKYPVSESKNKLTKAFFDIEVDSAFITGFPTPEEAACPVNAISLIDDSTMTVFEFLLRDKDNPQIPKLEKNVKKFKKRIKQKYKDEFDIDLKIKIVWFDDELELISNFFEIIHILQPDYCMAWNLTNFDMPYLINRISVLGADPDDIICDPELPYCYWKLHIDNKEQDPADKGSYFQVTDFTNWQDQLLLYANLRKQFGKKDSYKLDDIAYEELGARKVHFKNPKTTMKTSCRDDYEEFTEYSIHDSVLLLLLESKNEDCNMINAVSAKTETRVIKALKKTVCIKNLARRFYLNLGYVMSNNHNIDYGGTNQKTKKSFRGALTYRRTLNPFNCWNTLYSFI